MLYNNTKPKEVNNDDENQQANKENDVEIVPTVNKANVIIPLEPNFDEVSNSNIKLHAPNMVQNTQNTKNQKFR